MRAVGLLMLCASFAGFIAGQKKSQVEGPEHFRWSESNAHELDYSHTIKSAHGLTRDQKEALTGAVMKQLKSHRSLDEFFKDLPERQFHEIAASTRIELLDLNRDGTREAIAQAAGTGPCGATGNCIFWVFQMTHGGVRVLLDSLQSEAGFEKITVRPWTTNGFKDIVLGAHESASERHLVWYQYGNGSYRRKACYHLNWMGDDFDRSKKPAIQRVNCTDLFTPLK